MNPSEKLTLIKAKIQTQGKCPYCSFDVQYRHRHGCKTDEISRLEINNWLIKRVERLTGCLTKICAPESDGFGDFVSDEFTQPEILEARKFLKEDT